MSTQHPHDHFFRESFQKPEIIRSFLHEYLPPAMLAQLDLSTLDLQSDTHIDENLRQHQTDLLYKVHTIADTPLYLYLLFEHKSQPDHWVTLQLLRYMVNRWHEQENKGTGDYLTPIIPLVIYHGEKKWKIATNFHALFESLSPDLIPYTPQFKYQLHDFSHTSDVEIKGELMLRAYLEVVRAIFDPELREKLPKLIDLVFRLENQQTGLEYIYTILYYMSRGTDKIDMETMKDVLHQQGEKGDELMSTIAQELMQRGRVEGRVEGREEGRTEGVRDNIVHLLERKFGKVPLALSEQLEQQNLSTLQMLFDVALDTPSLEAFDDVLARYSTLNGK